jgi:hypothetical protein
MKEKLAITALAILVGVGLYYSHNAKQPADNPALSSIARVAPVVKSICVTPVQNLSHKNVAMDGVDDEFVAQLNKVGFVSQKAPGGKCDATTNAELVDITGRGRKTARIDFRLTLANEQVPRMSSSVEGKSGGKDGDGSLEKTVSEFKINPDPKESAGAEREAIVAALGKTAAQIDAANRKGLPPWSAKEQ